MVYLLPTVQGQKIGIKLDVTSKTEAKGIEAMVTRACRTRNYGALDQVSREVCIRMFVNQKWELLPELGGTVADAPKMELTLWRACELLMKYPETGAKKEMPLSSCELSMTHLVRIIGGSDRVFLVQDHRGIRPPGARKILASDPHPRFHDLRHTWRTNARRSGMDYQIAESIMAIGTKGSLLMTVTAGSVTMNSCGL